ncbi:hypothetical protein V1477_002839 [Vespula maculifrons]|uniref:Uncharacterized protein n=1 Tax=Vespula maculifrons TaxID=7453 RepID=A0ABD2CUU0_VESMC
MRKSVPKCGDAWGCNFSVWRLEFIGSFLSGGSLGMGPWAWASVRVSFQYRKIELDFRTLVLVKCSYILCPSFLFNFTRGSNISSKDPVHDRLLDANTGRIGRTLARVSAGTGVVFSGAIKSPTVMDFV